MCESISANYVGKIKEIGSVKINYNENMSGDQNDDERYLVQGKTLKVRQYVLTFWIEFEQEHSIFYAQVP